MDIQFFKKRFEQCFSARTTVQSKWQVIERYITPYRGEFFVPTNSEHSVQWDKREVFDSTAVMAAKTLASTIHGAQTSPAFQWFDVEFRQPELNEDQESAEWLDNATQTAYQSLTDSNFNTEAGEVYLDLVGPGTSFQIEEAINPPNKEWKGVEFTTLPLKECYFEPDAKGGIHRLYRLLNWPASRYVDKFGEENCPERVRAAYEAGPDERVEVVFIVYPEPANEDADTSMMLAPERRPFQFRYFVRADCSVFGGDAGAGGYYEMPAHCVRWGKASDSVWGHSPSHIAIYDVLSLNQTLMLRFSAAAKDLDRPQKVEERALLSDVNLKPGGITFMRDIDKMAPIDTGSNYTAGEIVIDDLRQAIRSYFHLDQLELKDTPAMTATEASIRAEQQQRLLGPTAGRIQTDWLSPTVHRTFRILIRAGRIPPPPKLVQESGSELDITYNGPLARAQKSDKAASIERYTMGLGGMAETLPEVLDVPDPDKVARQFARDLSIPPALLKQQKEVEAIREKRRKAQEAQQKAEIELMQAEAEAKANGQSGGQQQPQ